MLKQKLKKFNPYHRFGKTPAIVFIVLFAGVGTYLILYGFAAGTTNTVQLDNGLCGHNEQIATGSTISGTATPTFVISGDGGASSYAVSIDNQSIGTFSQTPTAKIPNVCVTVPTALSNGTHIFTATEVAPTSGNIVTPLTFTVDTTPPSTPTDLYLDPATNNNVPGENVTSSPTPEIDGVADPEVSVNIYINGTFDGGSGSNASGNFQLEVPPLTAGTYSITAKAYDQAGVYSAFSAPLTITVVSPISIAITSPLNNSTVSGVVNLMVNASDSSQYSINQVVYKLNGTQLIDDSFTSPFSYAWNTTATLTSGDTYTITATASDGGNDTNTSAPITFTYQAQGSNLPSVSISSPPSGSSVYGNGLFDIDTNDSANDNGSISSVELSVDNSPVQTLMSAPFNFILNALLYADKNHTITISATDNQGNVGTTSVSLTVTNGDLNGDGKVNISDLSILASNWGKSSQTYAEGNITGQSTVNISDLSVLATNWGWVE